jgi:hypothetical protein
MPSPASGEEEASFSIPCVEPSASHGLDGQKLSRNWPLGALSNPGKGPACREAASGHTRIERSLGLQHRHIPLLLNPERLESRRQREEHFLVHWRPATMCFLRLPVLF